MPFIRGFMSETAVVAAKGAWNGATSMGLSLLLPLLPLLLVLATPLVPGAPSAVPLAPWRSGGGSSSRGSSLTST